ncbi:MAG: hypothetical protein ACI4F4_05515 [Lachnospiraceae bacterium]
MDSDNWYKVDNVAKVFLATHTDRDTRSLRVSCTLNEMIDPECLEKALIKSIKSRPFLQVRIRRGFFWHYLETTDEIPVVSMEHERPCPVLYGKNSKRVLHYSVTYYHNRINFEVFHALSDGTGALEFLNLLVANYLKIKHPKELKGVDLGNDGSRADIEEDSFKHFYGKKGKASKPLKKSYHIRGRMLPYDQLQFFEITMKAKDVIRQAKQIGVSVSSLVGANLMLAIYKDMPAMKRKLPITISMPVNLRNYYPSETSRNFFNSINISHEFSGDESLESLAKEFDKKMKDSLNPDSIKQNMDHFQRLENIILVRMIPLMFKQPVVKYVSMMEAKKVSAVVSNLGVLKLPEPMAAYVRKYSAFCSHNELFMTILSFGDEMTFGITSGYRNTGVLKTFIRSFSKSGIEVRVNATEVVRS